MSGLQHQAFSGDLLSPVVLITAGKTIRYSRDNGVTMLEYEHNELYEVPDYVARGMYKRGWAKPAKLGGGNGDQQPHDPGRETPPPPPVQEPEPEQPQGEPSKEPNGGDENGDTAALKTKSKRSRS
jgi:hypothetical protein